MSFWDGFEKRALSKELLVRATRKSKALWHKEQRVQKASQKLEKRLGIDTEFFDPSRTRRSQWKSFGRAAQRKGASKSDFGHNFFSGKKD